MASTTPAARPGTVTFVVVLTWISAFLAIIGGILALTASDEVLIEAGISSSSATTYGIVDIVLGVLIAFVAIGLAGGNNLSRFLITALMVLRIAVGIWAIVALPNGAVTGVLVVAFALLIIVFLWNAKASSFFNTN
jgi:hypothetical protein